MVNEINVFIGGFDDGRTPWVQQYDIESRKYLCRLWVRKNVPYVLADNEIVGVVFDWRGNPPSKEYKTELIDASSVMVTVPKEAMERSGSVDMQLLLHKDGELLHGPIISFNVLKSMAPGDKETDEPVPLLVALVDAAGKAVVEAEEAATKANDAADRLPNELNEKLDKGGHAPDMYLGTDAEGNVVTKEAPEGGGGVAEETDPTVPEWAKQPNKPGYTKQEVGLSEVANERQYSAKNPPPYPVQSVNGKTGAVKLSTSDLENNSGFITKAVSDLANYYLKSETYTREEINQRISAIPKFSISVVSSLPTSNISETTIYLVGGGVSGNLYTEYIRVNGVWEILGSQRVDLTGYATETWVTGQLGSYLKASELEGAINTALAQAAASGEFDGADGVGIAGVSVTREPDEYGYFYITVELTDGQVQAIPYRNGTDGKDGVYVGSTAPTDPDADVWIDPEGVAPGLLPFFSDADIAELVNAVVAALPVYAGEVAEV